MQRKPQLAPLPWPRTSIGTVRLIADTRVRQLVLTIFLTDS